MTTKKELPRFVREDAALFAASTEASPRGSGQKLWEFIHDYDWLNRALPTYDEMSFGLARLVSAEYIKVSKGRGRGVRIRATEEGARIGSVARKDARSLGDATQNLQRLFGCRPWPESEIEDRSRGRLAGFEPSDYDSGVAEYEAWFAMPWGKRFADAVRKVTKGAERR